MGKVRLVRSIVDDAVFGPEPPTSPTSMSIDLLSMTFLAILHFMASITNAFSKRSMDDSQNGSADGRGGGPGKTQNEDYGIEVRK